MTIPEDARSRPTLVALRPQTVTMTRQGLPYGVGISAATAGSRNLSMNLVVVPPGGRSQPHLHVGHETAIYVLQGRVETRYGAGLRQSVVSEAGDFLFIPADLPHVAINLSATEPAVAVEARDDANDQQRVRLYDPAVDT